MNRTIFLLLVLFGLLAPPVAAQNTERLYQDACDNGEVAACNVFGLMYEFGDGVPQDPSRAVQLYQQACEGGELVGCTNLGLMYEAGNGVTQDVARAVGFFQIACEGGELLACGAAWRAGRPEEGEAEEFVKSGMVGNTETGAALSGAIIEVPALGIRTVSDYGGRFELSGVLPEGRYTLRAERLYYEPLEAEIEIPGKSDFLVLLVPDEVEDPFAPGGVSGRVTGEGGESGLPAVDIVVVGQPDARALSNNQGRFTFTDVDPGLAELRFTRLGYAPRTATLIVYPGQTVEVSAIMFAQPIEIEPIEVSVRPRYLEQNGFYRRAEGTGSGRQFTRRDLARINLVVVSDVIQRVAGVSTDFDETDTNRVIAINRRGTERCMIPVWIDGIQQFDADLNQIPAEQIEAMEIYHGVNTPNQYIATGTRGIPCGAVLIWTRRGN